MLCKTKPNAKAWLFILGVGLVSLAFGILAYLLPSAEARPHHLDTLFGMFSGFGAGLAAVALFKLIRDRLISPQKREQEEIGKQDDAPSPSSGPPIPSASSPGGHAGGFDLPIHLPGLPAWLYLCLGALYVQMIAF